MPEWIDLQEAKQAIEGGTGKGVKVAILDSGVEVSHPELGGIHLVDDLAIVPDGYRLRVAPGEAVDVFGHGTAVAALIRDLAPEAEIGSFRVLNSDNSSRTVVIQRAAEEALDRGYKILNCSFGCAIQKQVLQYKGWVDAAYLKRAHIVAACNNEDFCKPEWPAFFPSVIAVNMAQIDRDSAFYYRPGTLVEFMAKGVDVKVPWLGGQHKVVSGSSFAAPRLTGLLARLLSVSPEIGPLEAKAILIELALPWANGIERGNASGGRKQDHLRR
jgi:subtilisin